MTLKELIESMRLDVHETARAALMCFECGALVQIERDDSVVRDTLLGNPPRCAKCKSLIDVWKNTRFAMAQDRGLVLAAQVGARQRRSCTHLSSARRRRLG